MELSKMRLVFSSVRTDAQPATVREIVRTSQANNRADGITSVLLCDRSRFVQLLEGDSAPIDRCFWRIRNDPRHRDVTVLVSSEAEGRLFPDAPMQGIGPDSPDARVAVALSPRATSASVMEVFETLARQPGPAPEPNPALTALRALHQATRQVLGGLPSRQDIGPETLQRLGASLARQLGHARRLRDELDLAVPAAPEHRLEARQLCDLLETAQRDVAHRLDRSA